MNFAIISDTHYGVRKGSQIFHDYFEKFYSEVFFPTLDKRNIKTLVHMGDVFDSRKGVDFWSLDWAKRVVFDPLRERGITSYVLVGNHDAYYKNTNEINSVETLLCEYDNVIPVSRTEDFIICGTKILFVPWICSDNRDETLSYIEGTSSEIAMGHLDLNGFEPYRGHIQKDGMDPAPFKKFKKVFSGHFHTRSNIGNIHYIGNPYEIYWNDLDDIRGFGIFDTKSFEIEYIDNPNLMFKRVVYEDTDIKSFNFGECESKIVKVVVNKKTDAKKFEQFIDELYKTGVHELKIVEMIDVSDFGDAYEEDYTYEDTLSILNECIDSSENDIDKSKLKNIIQDIYKNAFEVSV